jgi:hypothetical protein
MREPIAGASSSDYPAMLAGLVRNVQGAYLHAAQTKIRIQRNCSMESAFASRRDLLSSRCTNKKIGRNL